MELIVTYWRMQLHPDDSTFSTFYAYQSIAKGFIGLGFANENIGDLLELDDISKLGKQSVYLPFATQMQKGDLVLIMSHHNPLAVVKVTSEYNYIRKVLPELGVWFNHFRTIDKDNIIYYSDVFTNVREQEPIIMTTTISSLSADTKSYQLIKRMVEWEKANNLDSTYKDYFAH